MFGGRRLYFSYVFIALVTVVLCAADLRPAQSAQQWGQSGLDNPPDPSILFGVLPNGMMYAIQRNKTPPGQTALRFLIKSGSNQEAKDQEGLAHFLEHMAFRGSTHVPDGQVVSTLERLGLLFGAHTNASTGPQNTTYKFDLMNSDDVSIDTGLMFMREIASELNIDGKIMQTEKGVVLSEERARYSPAFRAGMAQLSFLYGSHAITRATIGQRSVIEKASAERMRDYYRANYRPERAALVVVGDIDPKAIEAKIKAKFSDWKGKGTPTNRDPAPIVLSRRATEVKGVAAEGLTGELVVYWPQQYKFVPDTLAEDRRRALEILAMMILKHRVQQLAADAGKPFTNFVAGPNLVDYVADGGVFQMVGVTNWRASLDLSVKAVRQIVQYGVTQDEVDAAVRELRVLMQTAVIASSTRATTSLADSLIRAAFTQNVVTSPQQDLETVETATKNLQPAQLDAILRKRFSGGGPLLFYKLPALSKDEEAAMRTAFAGALVAPVTAYAGKAVKPWPYTNFGAAGAVAERRTDGSDITMARFANGTRVTVKSTDFSKGQILISVRFGHGRLDLPLDRVDASRLTSELLLAGGLKGFTNPELQSTLLGKVVDLGVRTADNGFLLDGKTRLADLDVQMQLLAAVITAPGWRSDSFATAIQALTQALRASTAQPSMIDALKGNELRKSGDPRWKAFTPEDLSKWSYDSFRTFLDPILAKSELEVIVVGDITADQAIDAVGKTIGALPARAGLPEPADDARKLKFPGPAVTPIALYHRGRADQGVAVLAWPTEGFSYAKPQNRFAGSLLEAILKDRVRQRLRTQQGATYSPSSEAVFSANFPDYGYILLRVEIPQAKMAGFFTDAESIAADIAANGVSDDELVRARTPLIDVLKNELQTNTFWLNCLPRAQADPAILPYCRGVAANVESLTAADVQAVAKKWLRSDTAWRLTITPEPGASTGGTP